MRALKASEDQTVSGSDAGTTAPRHKMSAVSPPRYNNRHTLTLVGVTPLLQCCIPLAKSEHDRVRGMNEREHLADGE